MPNVSYGGFRPWGTLSGGQGVYPSQFRGELANNFGTGVFKYDVLIPVSDGTLATATAGATTVMAVAMGFSFVSGGKRTPALFIPANTTFTPTTVGSANASFVQFIYLTPDVILEVDVDTAMATRAAAIGLTQNNADLAVGAGGDTSTGISSHVLNTAAGTGTGTAQFRVIGWTQGSTNDITLARAKALVVVNEGVLPPYTATGV